MIVAIPRLSILGVLDGKRAVLEYLLNGSRVKGEGVCSTFEWVPWRRKHLF